MNKNELENLINIELARRDGGFWNFCTLMIPQVYNEERRPYLKKLCQDLEDFWNDDSKKYLLLSCPPRHCKSLTISLMVAYLLKNNTKDNKGEHIKIMTGSYNEDFSSLMCKNIRDRIQEEKEDKNKIVYSDIYNVKILKGAAQSHKFQLEGSPTINVLSTSMNGSATGFGCNLIILDDMLKSAAESYNLKQKDKIYDWFVNTMLSRLEGSKQKVIVIGTRWCKDDLIGRILDWGDDNVVEINLKALEDDGKTTLCDDILNFDQLMELKKKLSPEIYYSNYMGQPMDLKDHMYNSFNTYKYEELKDIQFERIISYTDTADTGQDYLCSLMCGYYKERIYVLDIVYTKAAMEFTEPIVASKLKEHKVQLARVEGNNGGRSWARNVAKELKDLDGDTIVKTFTQTKNKQTRIFSNRQNIMNYFYYPEDWDARFSDYFKAMTEYKATSQNANDDAPDATTGVFETFQLLNYFGIN